MSAVTSATSVSKLVGYDCLVADAQTVLDTLVGREINLQTTDDRCYTMRMQPYRTLDNVIEGVVITFVNVTAMKRSETALQESQALLQRAKPQASRETGKGTR